MTKDNIYKFIEYQKELDTICEKILDYLIPKFPNYYPCRDRIHYEYFYIENNNIYIHYHEDINDGYNPDEFNLPLKCIYENNWKTYINNI